MNIASILEKISARFGTVEEFRMEYISADEKPFTADIYIGGRQFSTEGKKMDFVMDRLEKAIGQSMKEKIQKILKSSGVEDIPPGGILPRSCYADCVQIGDWLLYRSRFFKHNSSSYLEMSIQASDLRKHPTLGFWTLRVATDAILPRDTVLMPVGGVPMQCFWLGDEHGYYYFTGPDESRLHRVTDAEGNVPRINPKEFRFQISGRYYYSDGNVATEYYPQRTAWSRSRALRSSSGKILCPDGNDAVRVGDNRWVTEKRIKAPKLYVMSGDASRKVAVLNMADTREYEYTKLK